MKIFYTDGACSGNPGPGGWAVVELRDGKIRKKWGGYAPHTTNNRMELIAAIEALQSLDPDEKAELHTDSEYVRKGITEWMLNWKKKGWKTAAKKPVKNQDLWQTLDRLNHAGIRWFYVPGHEGYEYNELCDQIAKEFIQKQVKRALVP